MSEVGCPLVRAAGCRLHSLPLRENDTVQGRPYSVRVGSPYYSRVRPSPPSETVRSYIRTAFRFDYNQTWLVERFTNLPFISKLAEVFDRILYLQKSLQRRRFQDNRVGAPSSSAVVWDQTRQTQRAEQVVVMLLVPVHTGLRCSSSGFQCCCCCWF